MDITNQPVNNYINDTLDIFQGEIGKLQEKAYRENYPIIKKATANFLASLISAVKPSEILEIGCCIGFSSILMCSLMAEGGHVTTIDRYDVMIAEAKANFKNLGYEERITLIEGDAAKILPALNKRFDFIFLDAAKAQYMNFLPYIIKMLNAGGIFLADDVMLNGYAAMDRFDVPRRHRTTHKRMREFIYALTHAEGLKSSIIPCDNGLIMCTKTAEDVNISLDGFVYPYND